MKRVRFLGWAALAVAPWLLVLAFPRGQKIDLSCQANYEMLKGTRGGKEGRSYGTMTSYYHPDGSGISRYSGTLRTRDADTVRNFSVHRVNNFNYELIGAFVKVTSQKAAKYVDDNAEDFMVGEYVYSGFNADSVEYFKLLKIGEGAIAAGIGTMPRVYCELLPVPSPSQ